MAAKRKVNLNSGFVAQAGAGLFRRICQRMLLSAAVSPEYRVEAA